MLHAFTVELARSIFVRSLQEITVSAYWNGVGALDKPGGAMRLLAINWTRLGGPKLRCRAFQPIIMRDSLLSRSAAIPIVTPRCSCGNAEPIS